MLIVWILVFIIALVIMVKGADWLIDSSERIGLALGLSPFIVGVTIVGCGTSLPELISSLVAVLKGVTDVVAANAIGSNIANILLVVGLAALIGRRLTVSKDLIDLDLPLLAISTVILIGVAYDGMITRGESILILFAYGIYLLYTILFKDDDDILNLDSQSSKKKKTKPKQPKLAFKDFALLILGLIGLVLGAKYLIDALVNLSTLLNVATGVIAITAVAVGTSLPELLVSCKAAMKGKSEVALGNIFGSNIFNAFVVIGIPGLISTLTLDHKTLVIGLPLMALATLLFVISGISKRIHLWEGALYLMLYVLFVAKLFEWF